MSMFHKSFSSALSLSADVEMMINSGRINDALSALLGHVEEIITEPLCTSNIFGSKLLDDLCQKAGSVNLRSVGMDTPAPERKTKAYCYIVTKLQNSGGHTRVIIDFINSRPEANHIIFSTELDGRSDKSFIKKFLADNPNVTFEGPSSKHNFQERLTWLQQKLIQAHADHTYLFNHHQDSVAVAALQPSMELKASFYHHGDHHLSLGVCLPHVEHIDFHATGYFNCRENLGIKNKFIPLALEDKGARPPEMPFLNDGYLTTCTAARSNKVEVPYFIKYVDVIPLLLKETRGKHIHIGRLTPWAIHKIKSHMKSLGVPFDRFIYIPWVPSVWKALHEYNVDLYIASFPYGGGLTLIEAMGSGTPVVLHRHIHSRILSTIDLSYPEAFSWRYPADLINYCANIDLKSLKHQSKLARKRYDNFHNFNVFKSAISDYATDLLPPASHDNFFPDDAEVNIWIASQNSFKKVFMTRLYRLFKSIRRHIS